jgi:hypothetical protein
LGILTILGKHAFQVYGYRRLAVFIVSFMPLWVVSCCHNQQGTLKGKVHYTQAHCIKPNLVQRGAVKQRLRAKTFALETVGSLRANQSAGKQI